jgi:1,4-alpha-glucan branching enzyme
LAKSVNELYKSHSALYERDFEEGGFEWIDCHDYEQSILSFIRHSEQQKLICVFNFTPVPRENYRIGLPDSGCYIEVLNSDSELFGGSNLGNKGRVVSEDYAWMNQPYSTQLTLPPLSVTVLKLEL